MDQIKKRCEFTTALDLHSTAVQIPTTKMFGNLQSRIFSLDLLRKISVSVYGFLIRSTVFRLPFPSYHLSSWRLNWKPFSSLFSIWVLLLLEL